MKQKVLSTFAVFLLAALAFQVNAQTNTIYITKTSVGNIWPFDDGGNYYGAWPGQLISTLAVATVGDNEYYKFDYTHNTTNPKIVFNNNGNNQLKNP